MWITAKIGLIPGSNRSVGAGWKEPSRQLAGTAPTPATEWVGTG
jgi:hypothetical protein